MTIESLEKKAKRRLRVTLVAINVVAFFLFCGAHLLLMQNIRFSQADVFVTTQRNALLLGERRDYLVAAEKQKGAIFQDIRLSSEKPIPYTVKSNPLTGEIKWPLFFDEEKATPFLLLVFFYNPWMHSQWMMIAFSLTAISSSVIASRVLRRSLREHQKDEALRRSEALTTSMRMIAHDVRKPLATTQRFLNLLSDSSPHEQAALISKFRPILARSLEDVTVLLIESGTSDQPALKKEILNLAELVHEAAASCLGGRQDRTVTLSVPEDSYIQGDRRSLTRILHNLLDNAYKESPAGAEIWIRVRAPGIGRIEIAVGNAGSFIPEGERERIFGTFYTRSKKGGQGLGLSIVKKMVEAHDGTIQVASSHDKGTEFVISLPKGLADKGSIGPVLVIDDCPLILMQWRRLLSDQVVTVETSEELDRLIQVRQQVIHDASYAVIDYYFADGVTGENVEAMLRKAGFRGQALFASDAPEGSLPAQLLRLPKDPPDALKNLMVMANA